ncbi:ribosomal RNA small subunit methyltransferase H [Rickettsia endosymbiont of Cardiosporidium cionae]|nr:ribosomal RNA small subunit methyltransferase H [Rickettsia endosymbiont of Cardiosporidium cionae]
MSHTPVLLNEILKFMNPQDNKKYLDCTFGSGSCTKAILHSAQCKVTAIDRDPYINKYVQNIQSEFKERFHFINGNFAHIKDLVANNKFDGVVIDLGMSSMQIDSNNRGFSFSKDSFLDMRMSNQGKTAFEFVNNAKEEELANIIYQYGEEVQSKAIAKNIVTMRKTTPIRTTLELAKIIRDSMHYTKTKINPVTKTFQAIRIHINDELLNLKLCLNNLSDVLNSDSKILIISFHSLEDKIVKDFFKANAIRNIKKYNIDNPSEYDSGKWLQILTKKPIIATKSEVSANIRSRSAKLRVAQTLS